MKRAERGALGLIADIGGTNVRLALTGLNGTGHARVLEPQYFRAADFGGVVEVAQAYLSRVSERPRSAAFALAGVVRNGHVSITNRPWAFSLAEVREVLGLDELLAVNDFEAISWALPPAYVFEGMRTVLLQQTFRADYFWTALLLDAAYVAAGIAIFAVAVHSARKSGTLLQMGE